MSGEAPVLVLASRDDSAALWACRGLRKLGVPVRLLALEALAHAHAWDHRISDGLASIHIEVAGQEPVGGSSWGVLNRCAHVPAATFMRFAATDRDYAAQEWNALFASWLLCLQGPQLNPPTPDGLCGRERSFLEWTLLAHAAGFETHECRWSAGEVMLEWQANANVFVVGDEVLGCNDEIGKCALDLAEAAETPLLGISLDRNGAFLQASAMPDLRQGGEALLRSLARNLRAA